MRIDTQRLIQRFQNLVRIDSLSLGEREMADHVRSALEQLGFSVREDDAGVRLGGNAGNLHAFLDGELDPPLLFCVHLDTVAPGRNKQALLEPDGSLHSDGTTVLGADDAAGIATLLEALHTLSGHPRPHHPIEVLCTVAEELYCRGVAAFDTTALRARECYVLDLTGPVGRAAVAAPTILSFQADIRGRSAHAGFNPEDGIHAVAAAARGIARLRLGRTGADTTVNVGRIEGGGATNIVPDHCVVRGEIRSLDHGEATRAMELVRSELAAACREADATLTFSVQTESIAYRVSKDDPVARRFLNAAAAAGLDPGLEDTFGGSDNNRLVQEGLSGVVVANGMHRCHSVEEYTTVQDLEQVTKLLLHLMTSPD